MEIINNFETSMETGTYYSQAWWWDIDHKFHAQLKKRPSTIMLKYDYVAYIDFQENELYK